MATPIRRADNAGLLDNIALGYRQALAGTGDGPAPVYLASISPTTQAVSAGAATLTATGTGFKTGNKIVLDGTALTTTVVNATTMTASIVGTGKGVGTTSKVDILEGTGGPKNFAWT